MALASIFLAFIAGLSVHPIAMRSTDPADHSRSGILGGAAGFGGAGGRTCVVFHNDRVVRSDDRLFDRSQWRCVSLRCGRFGYRYRHRSDAARLQVQLAAASGPIANWTDQQFGSRNGRGLKANSRSECCWELCEPLCRTDARRPRHCWPRKDKTCRSRRHHVLFRNWRGSASAAAWALCPAKQWPVGVNGLMSAGQLAKGGLGILLIAIGALVITGFDKSIETVLVAASPQWLTDLTTRF